MSHESTLTLITLPKEIMVFNILPFLTLTELFEFCSIKNEYLQELLEDYMHIYISDQKYKKSLQEAIFLLDYEYFYDTMIQFFNSYFYDLATNFVSLVEKTGGSIHYNTLSLQDTPRVIYVICIKMKRNNYELLYKFSSVTFSNNSYKCNYSYSIDNLEESYQYIEINVVNIHMELITIFNLMGIDILDRKITSIELNKELYQTGFARSKQLPEIVNISKYE